MLAVGRRFQCGHHPDSISNHVSSPHHHHPPDVCPTLRHSPGTQLATRTAEPLPLATTPVEETPQGSHYWGEGGGMIAGASQCTLGGDVLPCVSEF